MTKEHAFSYHEAFSATIARIAPLYPVTVPIDEAGGLVAAQTVLAEVDCPAMSTALMDGAAVRSDDLRDATEAHPRKLDIVGIALAGADPKLKVESGWAVRIATGAVLPEGADAVIAREQTKESGGSVTCLRSVKSGENVLARGSDVWVGQKLVTESQVLTPAMTGLLAAGGIDSVRVFPKPKVGVIAIGNEVVLPGWPLKEGQLYASNLVTILSWLRHFGMKAQTAVVPDESKALRQTMDSMLSTVDALVTIGGTSRGDRDLVADALDEVADEVLYHGVRIQPGKSMAMGLVGPKPVFCLPGSPTASEIAFLQLAIPGLRCMSGRSPAPFQRVTARLTETIGGDVGSTQFIQATLSRYDGALWATPLHTTSRLHAQARAQAIVSIPEGVVHLGEGDSVEARVLFAVPKGSADAS